MSFKRIAGLLLVGFFIFFIVQSPVEAARVVRTAGESVGDVLGASATAFADFLSRLF